MRVASPKRCDKHVPQVYGVRILPNYSSSLSRIPVRVVVHNTMHAHPARLPLPAQASAQGKAPKRARPGGWRMRSCKSRRYLR